MVIANLAPLLVIVAVAAGQHQASLKRLPVGFSKAQELEYWQGIAELKAANFQAANVATFPVEDIAKVMQPNATGVPPELQGVWWWKDHPTMETAVFVLFGGSSEFGNQVYQSFVQPGGIAVPNTPKHVSDMSWFHKHGLQYAFPTLTSNTSMIPGKANTYLDTHMTGIYKHFPIPAAMSEGWNVKEAASWDPKKSEDVATCFCSIYYTKENELVRHNFGHYAYTGLRLMDGSGAPTEHWAELKAAMAAAGVTTLALVKDGALNAEVHV